MHAYIIKIIITKKRRKKMLKKLAKLIDVKSIVTFVLTGVFSYLSLAGKISTEQFMPIFTMVISFYFGTQVGKKEKEEEIKEEKDGGLK